MRLSATHTFNCIVFMVKFGRTSFEDIPPALIYVRMYNITALQEYHMYILDIKYWEENYVAFTCELIINLVVQ